MNRLGVLQQPAAFIASNGVLREKPDGPGLGTHAGPSGITTHALGTRSASSLVQNGCGATGVRNVKNQQRGIRTRLQPAIGMVDVDVGFAESGGRSRQFARPM